MQVPTVIKITLHLKSYKNLVELCCCVFLCCCLAFLRYSSFFGGETLIYVQSKIQVYLLIPKNRICWPETLCK